MAEKLPSKKGRKPKLDSELVAAALTELKGNISQVARKFSVDRSAVRQLIDKRPNLKRILNDAREGMLDDAESSLYASVVNREGWAVCFLLKTQGKSRGYIERTEHEHSGAFQLQIIEEIVDGNSEGGQI